MMSNVYNPSNRQASAENANKLGKINKWFNNVYNMSEQKLIENVTIQPMHYNIIKNFWWLLVC